MTRKTPSEQGVPEGCEWRPGPFVTTMRTDCEVIVRLNILLPYTLTDKRREVVEQVLQDAAEQLGGRITIWDLLYTDRGLRGR